METLQERYVAHYGRCRCIDDVQTLKRNLPCKEYQAIARDDKANPRYVPTRKGDEMVTEYAGEPSETRWGGQIAGQTSPASAAKRMTGVQQAAAWDNWRDGKEGTSCSAGNTSGTFLINRLWFAFMAGIKAAEDAREMENRDGR